MEKILENQEGAENIKNWDELYRLVEAGEIVTSRGDIYTTENLNEAIDVARATQFGNLNLFTRSEGFRSDAACLFIEEAESFEDLYKLLAHIDTVSGSAGNTYTGEELISQIQSIENIISADEATWEIQIRKLTRSYGIRDAVIRCLETKKS